MLILKVLGFVFLVPGALTVMLARKIVDRYSLDQKEKCDYESQMGEEEIKKYKLDKAIVKFKMLGLLIMLPGIILVYIAFK